MAAKKRSKRRKKTSRRSAPATPATPATPKRPAHDPDRPLRLEWLPAGELKRNERNWRRHPARQIDAMRASLDELGWAGVLLFNERTKRLIDGEMRLDLIEDPEQLVPVAVGRWSDEQERRLLLSLDSITSMAEVDELRLRDLLTETRMPGGLDAIGEQLHAELTVETAKPTELETMRLDPPPPALSWALIGIPTVRYGEIAESIERIARLPGAHVITTVESAPEDDADAGDDESEGS